MSKSKNNFNFWQKCLTYTNVLTVLVGLLFAFVGDSFVFEVYNDYTKENFFGGSEFTTEVLQLKKWLFGIIGGMIVGFAILTIGISENAFKNKEPWAYKTICLGLITWFIIDSAVSIYTGAIYNVVLINLFTLVLIGIPLVMTRSAFKKAS